MSLYFKRKKWNCAEKGCALMAICALGTWWAQSDWSPLRSVGS